MLHEVGDPPPLTMMNPPPHVGGYHIGYEERPDGSSWSNIEFRMSVKPLWLHRYMVRVLLGWEWRDDA